MDEQIKCGDWKIQDGSVVCGYCNTLAPFEFSEEEPCPMRVPRVPPHTLRAIADEIEGAGHTFGAKMLRELAEGTLVVGELTLENSNGR